MGYADVELYATLRSGDSPRFFPDNTVGDFYVQLPHTLNLDGEWFVGVNDIRLTKHWFNLKNASLFVSVDGKEYEEGSLIDGYYADNASFVGELTRVVDDLCSDECGSFSFNPLNNRLVITTRKGVKVKMNDELCIVVGLTPKYEISGKWESEKPMDIHANDRILMVYTDFISSLLVNDEMLTVIKILDVSNGSYGDLVHDNFMNYQARVDKDTFDVIHIQVRDLQGKLMKFEAGSLMIQLLFRRR